MDLSPDTANRDIVERLNRALGLALCIAKSREIMLSEQNLHFARLVSDRAIIIESGQKRFDGSFAELDAQPDVQEAYLSV